MEIENDNDLEQGLDMEKLAASLGSKMSGSSPETLNKIPGMEVIIVIIIIVIILVIIVII